MASWVRLALPYLPLLVTEGVVAVHLLGGSARSPAPVIVLPLRLIVLVLARQFLGLADHPLVLLELRSGASGGTLVLFRDVDDQAVADSTSQDT